MQIYFKLSMLCNNHLAKSPQKPIYKHTVHQAGK